MQDITKLPTATFNRALAALQEIHFIIKENGFYVLTWTGKLVTDALLMLGWRLSEEEKDIEKIEEAEKILAKDIAMAIVVLLLISLRRRGSLNFHKFENELINELKVAKKILEDYGKEDYFEIKNGVLIAGEKLKELDITNIFK